MGKIAITGIIGAGKSTVGAILRKKGLAFISADELVRRAVVAQSPGYHKLLALLGPEYLNTNKEFDFKKIAKIAFTRPELLLKMEAVIHPIVRDLMQKTEKKPEFEGQKNIFYEIPLLFEKHWDSQFDMNLVVAVDRDTQKKRLKKNRQMSEEEIGLRMRFQMSQEEKLKKADRVIWNNSSVEELESRVLEFIAELRTYTHHPPARAVTPGASKMKEKKDILQNFNPKDSLWVTSDIKSRDFVLNCLKEKHPDLKENNNCVVRAGDFWPDIFHKAFPEYRAVSRSFLVLIYEKWAETRPQEWQKRKETGALLCQYMEALAHLLNHPMRDSLMEDWKKYCKSGRKSLYWVKWYDLACEFWAFLEQKKMVELAWTKAYLVDNIPFKKLKFSEIVFDLGFEMDRVEAELIRQASSKINTKILLPFCTKDKVNNHFMYSLFPEHGIDTAPVPDGDLASRVDLQVKKFLTPLSEIKDITARVSKALQNGVPPAKINVLAPHIEDYWTGLKSHFKRENIPVNKTTFAPLNSFPVVQLWRAKLYTHLAVLKFENLETILSHESPDRDFNRLKSEYYNTTQIERWPKEAYNKGLLRDTDKLVKPEQFLRWAQALLPSADKNKKVKEKIEKTLKEFSQVTSLRGKWLLKYGAWLDLLESLIADQDLEVQEGSPQGINCLSFNALGWVESDFTYIAGLSEQNLKTRKHEMISSFLAADLGENLGFFIKSEPADKQEQLILSFIDQEHKQLVLSYASTDFVGTPENPSCLWLQKAGEQTFDKPAPTKWDQQQELPVEEILQDSAPQSQIRLIRQSLAESLERQSPAPFAKQQVTELSPSSLADYIQCPFIFASKKLFNLWDGHVRDMDIPPHYHGRLMHKLFETLKEHQIDKAPLTEKEILNIIEDLKTLLTKELKYIHPLIWEKEKSLLREKADLFLKEEQRRKSLFENQQTVALEQQCEFYWSLKAQAPAREGEIKFRGKIDRIDRDQNTYQIIDYKNNFPEGAVAHSWAKQKEFQMALYMQALELGQAGIEKADIEKKEEENASPSSSPQPSSPLPPQAVEAGLYLSYKNFEYKGLANKTERYKELLGGSSRKRSLVEEQKRKPLMKEVNKQINQLIYNIYKGHFSPKPKKQDICKQCEWRGICRAKHLS